MRLRVRHERRHDTAPWTLSRLSTHLLLAVFVTTLTLDSVPLPVDLVDPGTISNNRDQRLNLDSVYGTRKEPNPALYEADGQHLRVNGRDLPRNPDGSAIIGDPRNDENQVIAQIHVAFLRAHNRLIDQGTFEAAG